MNKTLKLVIVGVGTILSACSSTPKAVDNQIDVKGSTQNGVIGLKDGKAIIQEESLADQELRRQQWTNYELERALVDEHYWLKRCRTEIADPRLGGNGELKEIPEIDNMKSTTEVREEFGVVNNGDLKFVKREDYLERIGNERKYEQSLRQLLKLVLKSKADCERQMGYARLKIGLPSARYSGKYTYTEMGAIGETIQENENNLDDAFRIKEKLGKTSAQKD